MDRFILAEIGADQAECPCCGLLGSFSVYIDKLTGEPLEATFVGNCEGSGCHYHCTPRRYFSRFPLLAQMFDPPLIEMTGHADPISDEQFWADLKEKQQKWAAYRRQRLRQRKYKMRSSK